METNANKTNTNEIATIDTKLGRLIVSNSGYTKEGYPGFVLELEPKDGDGFVHQIAMIEVDETGDIPVLKAHLWDGIKEEPVYSLLSPEDIVKRFVF